MKIAVKKIGMVLFYFGLLVLFFFGAALDSPDEVMNIVYSGCGVGAALAAVGTILGQPWREQQDE